MSDGRGGTLEAEPETQDPKAADAGSDDEEDEEDAGGVSDGQQEGSSGESKEGGGETANGTGKKKKKKQKKRKKKGAGGGSSDGSASPSASPPTSPSANSAPAAPFPPSSSADAPLCQPDLDDMLPVEVAEKRFAAALESMRSKADLCMWVQLARCRVGDKKLRRLTDALIHCETVTSVDLSENLISDAGLRQLACALSAPSAAPDLISLNVKRNPISASGRACLANLQAVRKLVRIEYEESPPPAAQEKKGAQGGKGQGMADPRGFESGERMGGGLASKASNPQIRIDAAVRFIREASEKLQQMAPEGSSSRSIVTRVFDSGMMAEALEDVVELVDADLRRNPSKSYHNSPISKLPLPLRLVVESLPTFASLLELPIPPQQCQRKLAKPAARLLPSAAAGGGESTDVRLPAGAAHTSPAVPAQAGRAGSGAAPHPGGAVAAQGAGGVWGAWWMTGWRERTWGARWPRCCLTSRGAMFCTMGSAASSWYVRVCCLKYVLLLLLLLRKVLGTCGRVVDDRLAREDVGKKVAALLFDFLWSNVLHHGVCCFVMSALERPNSSLSSSLLDPPPSDDSSSSTSSTITALSSSPSLPSSSPPAATAATTSGTTTTDSTTAADAATSDAAAVSESAAASAAAAESASSDPPSTSPDTPPTSAGGDEGAVRKARGSGQGEGEADPRPQVDVEPEAKRGRVNGEKGEAGGTGGAGEEGTDKAAEVTGGGAEEGGSGTADSEAASSEVEKVEREGPGEEEKGAEDKGQEEGKGEGERDSKGEGEGKKQTAAAAAAEPLVPSGPLALPVRLAVTAAPWINTPIGQRPGHAGPIIQLMFDIRGRATTSAPLQVCTLTLTTAGMHPHSHHCRSLDKAHLHLPSFLLSPPPALIPSLATLHISHFPVSSPLPSPPLPPHFPPSPSMQAKLEKLPEWQAFAQARGPAGRAALTAAWRSVRAQASGAGQ
ncbi:unnamed protein product [Closterium sp. Naga37s-1]|nr:unnamed protein product [Closterium sp. Naga37s-1]